MANQMGIITGLAAIVCIAGGLLFVLAGMVSLLVLSSRSEHQAEFEMGMFFLAFGAIIAFIGFTGYSPFWEWLEKSIINKIKSKFCSFKGQVEPDNQH